MFIMQPNFLQLLLELSLWNWKGLGLPLVGVMAACYCQYSTVFARTDEGGIGMIQHEWWVNTSSSLRWVWMPMVKD